MEALKCVNRMPSGSERVEAVKAPLLGAKKGIPRHFAFSLKSVHFLNEGAVKLPLFVGNQLNIIIVSIASSHVEFSDIVFNLAGIMVWIHDESE